EISEYHISDAIRRPLRAADRERESGQSAAGAQRGPRPGVYRPHGARRRPNAARATIAGREFAARAARQPARNTAGGVGNKSAERRHGGYTTARREWRNRNQRASPDHHFARLIIDQPRFRTRTGAGGRAAGSE